MLNNPGARKAVTAVLEQPARLLMRLHVLPDAVTLFGTLGAVVTALVRFPQGRFILGPLLITAFAFSDLLDGTDGAHGRHERPLGQLPRCHARPRRGCRDLRRSHLVGAAQRPGGASASLPPSHWPPARSPRSAKARAEAVGASANVGIVKRAERLIVVAARDLPHRVRGALRAARGPVAHRRPRWASAQRVVQRAGQLRT